MKTLYMIRHAKSSWAFDLPDHDRPLGKRGRKDVIRMGQYLAMNQAAPEALISSTASRAFYTALFICDGYKIDEGKIRLVPDLFHAGAGKILEVIKEAPRCERLAIFGHNPGFTSATNALANANIPNVPTCGVVGIKFNIETWQEADFGKGVIDFQYFPKEI